MVGTVRLRCVEDVKVSDAAPPASLFLSVALWVAGKGEGRTRSEIPPFRFI